MDEPKTSPIPVIDASQNVSDVPTPSADGRPVRTESDSLGMREIPADAYWGVHTSRALENFQIAKRPISVYPDLIVALASVKQAAARANLEIGVLEPHKADLIDRACQLIIDGKYHDQFVVGVMQGGAGTSTNMNANEVIANVGARARRQRPRASTSTSTRSTTSTAARARTTPTRPRSRSRSPSRSPTCSTSSPLLRDSFARKGEEFRHVLKVGRTQLQDAVPMTLGQEFHGFATTLTEDHARLTETKWLLAEINLGATAIGTGITADPGYAAAAAQAPQPDHRAQPRDRTRPDRVDQRRRRVHVVLGRAEAQRDQAVEDLQRPPAALLAVRRRVSARSTCRRARRGRASCPARSTRSSPRSSTRSRSRWRARM